MLEVVAWDDDGTPRSPRFDDIYRSAAGGLAQARHVFLQGCGLPQAWAGRVQWRILETGFGLGSNFLATWQAWKQDPQRPRMLHFASVEAWPVAAADLLRGAADQPELEPLARELAGRWYGLTPGFHRLSFEQGQVLLTLCVGDAAAMLRELSFRADAVFLDGFEPQRNPQMWEPGLLKAVARLCLRGTRLATWTVAGQVRRDLASCGFEVQKVPGLPPKRDCLRGRYAPHWQVKGMPQQEPAPPPTALVIGCGLAGAAVAASLARRGCAVQVLDRAQAPAAGASGLPVGLMAPHQSPDDNFLSRLSRAGIRITLQAAQAALLAGSDWAPVGVLERRGDDDRPVPDVAGLEAWTRKASDAELAQAGMAAAHAWWHPHAAWVKPAALVWAWLGQPGVSFRGGCEVASLARQDGGWLALDAQGRTLAQAPLVVVATAHASGALLAGRIATRPVRGQISWNLQAAEDAALPPFPVNGQGHFVPRVPVDEGQAWFSGSTYGRGDDDTRVRPEDHSANLERLRELLPAAAERLAPQFESGAVRAWAGVRCASTDRRPLVGELEPGLWVSTAMGSRGLSFAALCGEWIAAQVHGEPWPLEARLAQALDARRQLKSA